MNEHGDTHPESAEDSSAANEPTTQPAVASLPPASPSASPTSSPASEPPLPDYKGAPIDPERGPGLGCFWFQVILLVAFLIITPISVVLSAPPWLSAALLILSLVLLFFVGQTMIFLLRLVAMDRRTRRRSMGAGARKTVGQIEDEAVPASDSAAAPAPGEKTAPALGEETPARSSDEDDSSSDEPLT